MVKSAEQRPLRADAERNRKLLLEAAARAFAQYGADVSTIHIAQEAGVGQGTLYRRFPSKEHLIAAIVSEILDDFIVRLSQVIASKDAGAALREFMASSVKLCLENQAFLEAISGPVTLDDPGVKERYAKVLEMTSGLVKGAQKQRELRKDVTADDILSLIGAISNAGRRRHADIPGLWERYLDIVFDGLRPEAAHPLRHPPVDGMDTSKFKRPSSAKLRSAQRRA